MTGQLEGLTALVTGASRGIGRATAVALAGAGANVILAARSEDELASLAEELEASGANVLAVPTDVAVEDDVWQLKSLAFDHFGQVDILVNNVGVGKYGPLSSLSVQDYDWMMNTNMRSSFLCTAAFLPEMVERGSGHLVFIASVAGLKGLPHESVYCATKFAQVGFAQSLDHELRERGVKVSVIAPGGVHTHFAFGSGRTPGDPMLDDMLDPADVANAVLFAVGQPPKSRVFLVGMRPMSEAL